MQYLVDRYDQEYKISFPKGTREWYEMNNWLFFQNAGVGPMQGQASKSILVLIFCPECFTLHVSRNAGGRSVSDRDVEGRRNDESDVCEKDGGLIPISILL